MKRITQATQVLTPRTLYSGPEEEFYNFCTKLILDSHSYQLKASDFYKSYFGLEPKMTNEVFKDILKSARMKKSENSVFKDSIISSSGLMSCYQIPLIGRDLEPYLVILSFGEINRGIYEIFLDGAWKIKFDEIPESKLKSWLQKTFNLNRFER